MSDKKIRVTPEFEQFCYNLKKEVEHNLNLMFPNQKFDLPNTNIQTIIANMNDDGIKVSIKKLNSRRYKLVFL